MGCRFSSRKMFLAVFHFASRTNFETASISNKKQLLQNANYKKCPIPRANIIYFDTLALYQNVIFKMSLCYRIDTKRHPYQ